MAFLSELMLPKDETISLAPGILNCTGKVTRRIRMPGKMLATSQASVAKAQNAAKDKMPCG